MTSSGLEDAVAADTVLSSVDGAAGRLVIRGRTVEDVARSLTFPQTCALLWTGDPHALPTLPASLGHARAHTHSLLPHLDPALHTPDPTDALRGALALLSPTPDPNPHLLGAIPVVLAAWRARHHDLPLLTPDPDLPHAQDTLRLLHVPHTPAHTAALDAYWSTVIDHGLNASTFTARIVASTGSDPISATVAALGALKGPLHGGAPGPVLDMLDAVGTPERAPAWVDDALDRGQRIMGIGHRVYRVRDPRAAALEHALDTLAHHTPVDTTRLALARAVEHAAVHALTQRKPDRPLAANVEFYTALLLDALQLPRALFTPLFAASRAAGWLAHMDEQRATGRLIRPRARYVGPTP